MAVHELKTWSESFVPIWDGAKVHDIRRMDRPFAAGDEVWLREWEPSRPVNDRYTGRELVATITFVSRPGTFGLPDELCVLSLQHVRRWPVPR